MLANNSFHDVDMTSFLLTPANCKTSKSWFFVFVQKINGKVATVCQHGLQKLLADKDAANTKKVTKLAVHIFTTYLRGKNR